MQPFFVLLKTTFVARYSELLKCTCLPPRQVTTKSLFNLQATSGTRNQIHQIIMGKLPANSIRRIASESPVIRKTQTE